MKTTTEVIVIADNGGGLTIQTDNYCHGYVDPKQAAEDLRGILHGDDTSDWEGNEPDYRQSYNYETERNGGYKWFDDADIREAVACGEIEAWGAADAAMWQAMGLRIID